MTHTYSRTVQARLAALEHRAVEVRRRLDAVVAAGHQPVRIVGNHRDWQGVLSVEGIPVVGDPSLPRGTFRVESAAHSVQGCWQVEVNADPATPHTYVRRGAGHTERAAAARALPRSGTDRRLLYDLLIERPQGLTVDEASRLLATRTGRPDRPNQWSSRMLELREAGLVTDTGQRRATRTGSPAVVWQRA